MFAAVVLTISLCAGPAFSQEAASLTGKVSDPGGLAIVGANVLVTNVETNAPYQVTTNEAGMYALPNLPPGTYRITVSKEGFGGITRPDVIMHVADKLSIDFPLQ